MNMLIFGVVISLVLPYGVVINLVLPYIVVVVAMIPNYACSSSEINNSCRGLDV